MSGLSRRTERFLIFTVLVMLMALVVSGEITSPYVWGVLLMGLVFGLLEQWGRWLWQYKMIHWLKKKYPLTTAKREDINIITKVEGKKKSEEIKEASKNELLFGRGVIICILMVFLFGTSFILVQVFGLFQKILLSFIWESGIFLRAHEVLFWFPAFLQSSIFSFYLFTIISSKILNKYPIVISSKYYEVGENGYDTEKVMKIFLLIVEVVSMILLILALNCYVIIKDNGVYVNRYFKLREDHYAWDRIQKTLHIPPSEYYKNQPWAYVIEFNNGRRLNLNDYDSGSEIDQSKLIKLIQEKSDVPIVEQ